MSFHLGQIDEDNELCLIDDLGAEHEESSPDEEDEILIVDKERHIGSIFEHQNQLRISAQQIPADINFELYDDSQYMEPKKKKNNN